MASSWGDSWRTSWGDSWGVITTTTEENNNVPTVPTINFEFGITGDPNMGDET